MITFMPRLLLLSVLAMLAFAANSLLCRMALFSAGWRAGERFSAAAWMGLGLAITGLLYLVSPGLAAPPPVGATLMASAGVDWGLYSLRGRRATDPLPASAGNFLRALPLALAVSAVAWPQQHVEPQGVMLAQASGALTSGLGYVICYAALPRLTAMRAVTMQLSVPPLAAFGGVLWLAEVLTFRLVLASAAILGGILLVLLSRAQ